jgi:aspartate/methionine/tyrosine aminotransferase
VAGLRPIVAQGTFYLTVLLDLNILNFTDDVHFVTVILAEENVSAFPISCAGSKKY